MAWLPVQGSREIIFSKSTLQDWDTVMRTNLRGTYNTLLSIIPKLYERREGSIVCISSFFGERGNAGQTSYAASKAGMIGSTKALALKAFRYGVRANAVAPALSKLTGPTPFPIK